MDISEADVGPYRDMTELPLIDMHNLPDQIY